MTKKNIVIVKPKLKRLIIPIYETKNKIIVVAIKAIKSFFVNSTSVKGLIFLIGGGAKLLII